MASCECCCFIQEEQLGPAIRGHDLKLSAFEFQETCDPRFEFVRSFDFTGVIVNNSTVSHQRSARGSFDQGAEWSDAVLKHERKVRELGTGNEELERFRG